MTTSAVALESAPGRSKLVLPVILLAVFVMPISIAGTPIALPRIAVALGSSPTALQWVVNGFNVAFALFTLVWGTLSDRIGYRATFIIGVIIMLAGSVLGTAAARLAVVDIARVLMGIGGAAIFTGSSALLSNAFPDSRARIFAIFGTTIGLGTALGPTISGGLIAWLGWRGVFAAFAVVAGVALLLSRGLPQIRHEHDPTRKPLDFTLLRIPHFLAMCLVPVAGAIGFVTMLSYLPTAFSAIYGFSAGKSGIVILPMTIPVLIGPILAIKLLETFKRVAVMTMVYASTSCLVFGDVGMLLLSARHSWTLIIVPMILLGFGFGLTVGLVDGEALAAVPARSSGTAAGVLNFMRLGSEAIAVLVYAAVLAALIRSRIADQAIAQTVAAGRHTRPLQYASALHIMILAIAILAATVTTLIAFVHRARIREDRRAIPQSPG